MAQPVGNNYNSAAITIRVDPVELHRVATVDIKAQAELIGASLERIGNIWKGLELGWAGRSSQEAQDFGNRFRDSFTRLFGTPSVEGSGALNRLWTAVGLAAVNYGVVERDNTQMFTDLLTALRSTAPPSHGPDQPTSGSVNYLPPHPEH